MPLPYVKKVGRATGRGTPAAEADWARAKAIVAKEYGDIPDDKRYAIVTRIFQNISKGHAKAESQVGGGPGPSPDGGGDGAAPGSSELGSDDAYELGPCPDCGQPAKPLKTTTCKNAHHKPKADEMMMSGDVGGFRDDPIGLVVAGSPAGGPAKVKRIPGRFKKPKTYQECLTEEARRGHICPECKARKVYMRTSGEDTSFEEHYFYCPDCRKSFEGEDKKRVESFEWDDGRPDWEARKAAALEKGLAPYLRAVFGLDGAPPEPPPLGESAMNESFTGTAKDAMDQDDARNKRKADSAWALHKSKVAPHGMRPHVLAVKHAEAANAAAKAHDSTAAAEAHRKAGAVHAAAMEKGHVLYHERLYHSEALAAHRTAHSGHMQVHLHKESVVAEEMPLGNVITVMPDTFHVVAQDSQGYEAPDKNDDAPKVSNWNAAAFKAGAKFNQPRGTAKIRGKVHNVYGGKGKLHAVPSDRVTSAQSSMPPPARTEAMRAACPYTAQAIAAALAKAGVSLASHGARHEASGAEVVKVGDMVAWRWRDFAGVHDRLLGEQAAQLAIRGLGFQTVELLPGDGSWIILDQPAASATLPESAPQQRAVAELPPGARHVPGLFFACRRLAHPKGN